MSNSIIDRVREGSKKSFLTIVVTMAVLGSCYATIIHPTLSSSIRNSKKYTTVTQLMQNKSYSDAEKLLNELIANTDPNNIVDDLVLKNLKAKSIMHQWRVDQALSMYEEIEKSAGENNLDSIQADVITALLVIYKFQQQTDKLHPLIRKGLSLKNIGYKERSDLYTFYADLLRENNQIDSALEYTYKAIDIDLEKMDSSSLSFNHNTLGLIYSKIDMDDKAFTYYLKSLSYLKNQASKHKQVSIYSNISSTMLKVRNIPKAKEYAMQALEMATEIKLKSNLAFIHSLMARIHEIDENYSLALEHIVLSAQANAKPNKLQTKIENAITKAMCQFKLQIPIDQNELQELQEYRETSDKKMINLSIDYLTLYNKVNKGYYKNNFYDHFNPLKEEAEKYKKLKILKDLYLLEYKFLEEKEDYKSANHAILNYHSYVNELIKERQDFLTLDLEAKYSKAKQDEQIVLLAKDNVIQEVKLKQQSVYLIGGSIGLLIISILSFLIYRLYIKLSTQNAKISKALKEKDFLLREIHHRVKNNLQVISSLLSLQSRQITDNKIKKAITEGRNRVRSMALIHQNLYQNENLNGVSVAKYMSKLVNELFDTYKIDHSQILLELDIQEMELDVDTMVPIGLILNELVSNCLKHAFPDNRQGSITVSLNHINDNLLLKVKDNGIGTTLEELQASKSFGNRLIKAFSQKLKADIKIKDSIGTEVVILIKKFKKVA